MQSPNERSALLEALSEGRRHGTLAGYTAGCRCKWCRLANRAYHGADMARRAGRHLRVVGPEALTERIALDLTADELELYTERAEAAGLSRQAYLRRAIAETVELERVNERIRERELATPLLEHGG
jgi:hypothetical protein